MKRSHLNLALLVIVAGLGTAVWFSQKKVEKGPPLTPLKQDAITRVAVEHPGKPTIRLVKENGKWKLVEPVQVAVDPFEINGILGLAEFEVKQKLDAASVKRSELELDPPKYTVTLDDQKIAFGGTEPIKYRRYVETGGAVDLIDDPPSAALDDNYSDLVARDVVPEGRELTGIALPGLTLTKAKDGTWSSPEQPQAKPELVAKLAQSWKEAKSMWNGADDPATTTGDAVKLTLADGGTVDYLVQARDPQLVLASPALKVRYTLSKALVDELFKVPAEEKKEEAAPGGAASAPEAGVPSVPLMPGVPAAAPAAPAPAAPPAAASPPAAATPAAPAGSSKAP